MRTTILALVVCVTCNIGCARGIPVEPQPDAQQATAAAPYRGSSTHDALEGTPETPEPRGPWVAPDAAPEAQGDAVLRGPEVQLDAIPDDTLVEETGINADTGTGAEAGPEVPADTAPPLPSACQAKTVTSTGIKTCGWVNGTGSGKQLLWLGVGVCKYDCQPIGGSIPDGGWQWGCDTKMADTTGLVDVVCLASATDCSQCVP